MLSRPAALALVAAGCVAAAGVGAYVAVRQGTTGALADPAVTEAARPADPDAPEAVAETEAIVEPPATGAPEPVPEPRSEPQAEPAKPVAPAPAKATRSAEARPAPRPRPEPPAEPDLKVNGLDEPWPPRPVGATPPAVLVAAGVPADVGRPVEIELYDPPPVFEELVVSADSVLGLQIQTTVSTDTAELEAPVEARVIRDVTVAGQLAVPAGTRVLGSVIHVERGGKVKERARLGVRFHTLVLADMTRVPIQTDAIYRDGERPSNQSAKKIGGAAVGGAILGAILGGTKGAAVGGAAG
ncbi:MAG: hypothetical protein ABIG85_02775, partial [Chloroflexota bacterium]